MDLAQMQNLMLSTSGALSPTELLSPIGGLLSPNGTSGLLSPSGVLLNGTNGLNLMGNPASPNAAFNTLGTPLEAATKHQAAENDFDDLQEIELYSSNERSPSKL